MSPGSAPRSPSARSAKSRCEQVTSARSCIDGALRELCTCGTALERRLTGLHAGASEDEARLRQLRQGAGLASGAEGARIRQELRMASEEQQELQVHVHAATAEHGRLVGRVQRTELQLMEVRQRIGVLRDEDARMRAVVDATRTARAKSHDAAARGAGRLRGARGRTDSLRRRIRALEEDRLRYPSMEVRVDSPCPAPTGTEPHSATVKPAPLEAMDHGSLQDAPSDLIRAFVNREEARLRSPWPAELEMPSWDASPVPAPTSASHEEQTTSPCHGSRASHPLQVGDSSPFHNDHSEDLSALLAAEPIVLNFPRCGALVREEDNFSKTPFARYGAPPLAQQEDEGAAPPRYRADAALAGLGAYIPD